MRAIQYSTKKELNEFLSEEKGKILAKLIVNKYYSVLWFNFLNAIFDRLERQLLRHDNDPDNKYLLGNIDSIITIIEDIDCFSEIKSPLIK